MELLNRIRELASDRGQTVADVERGAGLTKTSLAKWNMNAPSIDKVIAVADYFGITLDELVGRGEPTLTPSERELLSMYRSMNDEGQMDAFDAVLFIASKPRNSKKNNPDELPEATDVV